MTTDCHPAAPGSKPSVVIFAPGRARPLQLGPPPLQLGPPRSRHLSPHLLYRILFAPPSPFCYYFPPTWRAAPAGGEEQGEE